LGNQPFTFLPSFSVILKVTAIRELDLISIGHFGEPGPAFKGDGAILFVKSGDTKSIRSFEFIFSVFGVGIGMHGNLVAQTVLKISGPGERRIRNGVGTGFFILRFPPTTVYCVYNSRTGKGKGTIAV